MGVLVFFFPKFFLSLPFYLLVFTVTTRQEYTKSHIGSSSLMSFTKLPTKALTGTGVKDGLVKKKMFVPEVSLSNVKNVPKEFQDILRSALGVLFKKFTENYNNRIMRYGNFEEIEFLKSEPQEMLSNFINIYGNIVANDPSDKLVKIDKIVIKFLEGFVNEKEKSLKAFLNEKQVKKVETVAEKPREEFANFHDFYIHY